MGPLDLPTGRRGRLLALGMTFAVLGALWAGVAAPLLDWHALRAIAALTEILPDDTWLTELTLRQRKLTMAGRSAGAARLIGLLSADPTIRDAAFAAPVTRAEGTRAESGGVDAFSIRAELRM